MTSAAEGPADGAVATLTRSLTRIRVAASSYMDERDAHQLGWTEEAVTAFCVHKGLPHVKVVEFNRSQERSTGADWLWWWLGQDTTECFGMLVQAKRLTHPAPARWEVNIKHRNGEQYRDLLRAADDLDVPALYAVYTGGQVFRADLRCPHNAESSSCQACEQMSISTIAAFQLSPHDSPTLVAEDVFSHSTPLERIPEDQNGGRPVRDLNLRHLPDGELRQFLLEPQAGPRAIAKQILRLLSEQRLRAFETALADRVAAPGDCVFSELPADRGHFPGPYFAHVLRGLRTDAPNYVRDLQAGFDPPAHITESIAGVVLVSLDAPSQSHSGAGSR